MTPRLTALIKSIVYPGLLLSAHHLVEHLPQIAAMLGPQYAWIAGPLVVGIGGVILHQLDAPGGAGGNA